MTDPMFDELYGDTWSVPTPAPAPPKLYDEEELLGPPLEDRPTDWKPSERGRRRRPLFDFMERLLRRLKRQRRSFP